VNQFLLTILYYQQTFKTPNKKKVKPEMTPPSLLIFESVVTHFLVADF
jgi:hypothetical protein